MRYRCMHRGNRNKCTASVAQIIALEGNRGGAIQPIEVWVLISPAYASFPNAPMLSWGACRACE